MEIKQGHKYEISEHKPTTSLQTKNTQVRACQQALFLTALKTCKAEKFTWGTEVHF